MRRTRYSTLFAGLCLAMVFGALLRHEPASARTGAPPVSSLLGGTVALVIAQVGVPDDIEHGGEHLTLIYEGKKGVRLFDDCVYWIDPDLKGILNPRPVPSTGAYLGQPLRELLLRLGQPDSTAVSFNWRIPELQMSFGTLGIDVHEGVVVGFR